MKIDAQDVPHLKTWILNIIEVESDADSNILADYILALLQTNESDWNVRMNCEEQLKDFLHNGSRFVDQVFKAIGDKSFRPKAIQKKLSTPSPPPPPPPPKPLSSPVIRSSKRRHAELETQQPLEQLEEREIPSKQARLTTNGSGRFNSYPGAISVQEMPSLPPVPTPIIPVSPILQMEPQVFPILDPMSSIDPNDPMSLFLSVQMLNSFMGIPTPPMPPEVLDSMMNNQPQQRQRQYQTRTRRASFSVAGRPYNATNSALVVENIPKDFLDSEQVLDFFSQFGQVIDLQMQYHRYLAIVKFAEPKSAQDAFTSPKSIFDNRFVKIFWYEPEPKQPTDVSIYHAQISAAQQAFEKRENQKEALRKEKLEIEQRLRQRFEARKALLLELAAKEGHFSGSTDKCLLSNTQESKSLRRQLANLEKEAISLGVDPSAVYHHDHSGGAESSSAENSRLNAPISGSGSGLRQSVSTPAAVMRWDSRPKKLVADGIAMGTIEEENLRQAIHDITSSKNVELLQHPTRADAIIISFSERYMAEMMLDDQDLVADRFRLSWYRDPVGDQPGAGARGNANNSSSWSSPYSDNNNSSTFVTYTTTTTTNNFPIVDKHVAAEYYPLDLDVAEYYT